MKRVGCALLFILTVLMACAQDLTLCSDEAFREAMNAIVSKGNHFYDTDNRDGIMQMADSLYQSIENRYKSGLLLTEDSLEFKADWHKLMGSYYYEESFFDSTAYSKSESHYNQSLAIYHSTSVFVDDLDKEPLIHRELAQLYYRQGLYQQAFDQTKMAYDAFSNAVEHQGIEETDPDYLDIQSQLAMCYARIGMFKEAIKQINCLVDTYESRDVRYGEALRKKAKILMLSEEGRGQVDRTEALRCYKVYFDLKKKDALQQFMGMSTKEREQYWMHVRPFVADCYRLEDADAGFLYDVTLFAKGLLLQLDSTGGGLKNIHATWQMIQERLKTDDCAIEFVQYEKYGKQQMGALVLRKTGTPVFVKMVSPDSLLNYRMGDNSVKERINGTGRANFIAIDRVYNDSTGVFPMIWNHQLLSAIGNVKRVYFAPDGYMHRIAIEYMLPKCTPRWLMYRLSSTRRLLESQGPIKDGSALVLGAVDYNKADDYPVGNNDALAYKSMKGMTFNIISESRREIDSILVCRNNIKDTVLTQDVASEGMFRKLCGSYQIVHLSTHGKFNAKTAPFGSDIKPCMTDETLSDNIIALAGTNASVKDERFNPDRQQDGILSAREIASLDMKSVQLAVLACCESGLGHVTADGVYGIQRGLKNAGAGAIVMSLWEAESKFTEMFMIEFYKRLGDGNTVGEAFWEARESFLPEEEPSCRNVFVLIDAIE